MATDGPILVIEDDGDVREAMTGFLEEAGYRVVSAADGKHAVEALRGERPALMIVDMYVPRMERWHVLESLTQVRQLGDVPVIVTLGGDGGITQRAAGEFGSTLNVQQIFVRPVEMRELLDEVNRLAGGAAAEAAQPAP